MQILNRNGNKNSKKTKLKMLPSLDDVETVVDFGLDLGFDLAADVVIFFDDDDEIDDSVVFDLLILKLVDLRNIFRNKFRN